MGYRKVILTIEQALKRRCTVCNAKPNRKCITATGEIMENLPHKTRRFSYITDIDRALSDPGNSGP